MEIDWIEIVSRVLVEIAIPVIAVLVGARLTAWLRAKGVAVDRDRLQAELRQVMELVVRWAEQRYGVRDGEVKRVQAQTMLRRMGYNPQDPEVDAALEAMVNELNTFEWKRGAEP